MSVYFIGIKPDGPVKVGFSNDPVRRLAQLQTASPQRLELLGYVVDGDRDLERALLNDTDVLIMQHLDGIGGEWISRRVAETMITVLRCGLDLETLQLLSSVAVEWHDVRRLVAAS